MMNPIIVVVLQEERPAKRPRVASSEHPFEPSASHGIGFLISPPFLLLCTYGNV